MEEYGVSKEYRYAVVHVLALSAIMHLMWVSFVEKTADNQMPRELLVTTLLFALTYFAVFLLWLIDIPFQEKVPAGTRWADLLNKHMYGHISYISPFKADKNTGIEITRNDTSVRRLILENYHNQVMPVVAILFYFGLLNILLLPNQALELFGIIRFSIGYFLALLVLFYGTGSVTLIYLIKLYCAVVGRRQS